MVSAPDHDKRNDEFIRLLGIYDNDVRPWKAIEEMNFDPAEFKQLRISLIDASIQLSQHTMSSRMTADLVIDALRMGVASMPLNRSTSRS